MNKETIKRIKSIKAYIMYYDMEGWISSILDIVFTHWMPIPELPKE